ncbi:helix-turn-helix domain-containing protein [Pseudogulbenkiania subflava]|uniref:DNA binding domain-containing protein, excisionase family n=1 Tax=Pseudogulbenkiania subflava DSM 22618 TaxID=1123014 RepID=A0A1Y6BCG3_9NEIS|nr:helix-turn-helix domain-containing protein [Pseudogulbenkiania subflava]SMF04136.1 DNA binding domain-containing protein, excisionase family [Pseudogulbenkiania subflava DSM 22618]
MSIPKLAFRIPEAAEALGICRAQVYKLMDAGFLKFTKIGADRRIPLEEIQRLAKEGCPEIPAYVKKSGRG